MDKTITIGYMQYQKERFISNIIITNNFLGMLSNFVKITIFPAGRNLTNINFSTKMLNADYLLVDIKNFGARQFILREKTGMNIPFIIMLHTVYDWIEPLMCILPLIRDEDIIIVPSEYLKRSFLKLTGKFKVHVIPHCLDVIQIQRDIAICPKKYKREITFLGFLSELKGVDALVECMPAIISKVGDVHLSIIGPLSGWTTKNYPKSIFSINLEKRIKELKMENNITLKGAQFGLNKYRILAGSDIFIYPTIYRGESFGVPIIEALACGIPVITTDFAAGRELVKEYTNGYLTGIRINARGDIEVDREELISLAVRIFRDVKKTALMKRKACETAMKYDFRKILPFLVKLLKKKKGIMFNSREKRVLKNKKISEFKNIFRKQIHFFLYYYGLADKTYADIYNERGNKRNNGMIHKNLSGERGKNIRKISRERLKKINFALFKYLCDAQSFWQSTDDWKGEKD